MLSLSPADGAGTGAMFPALTAMVRAVFYDQDIEPGCARSSSCAARTCSAALTNGMPMW
jgi:hypothetical protein